MVGAAAGTGHTSAAMSATQPPESQIAESPVDESPPPVVLQVLPSLVTGGVERGTIEITQAVAEAGGVALVASAGGRMVGQVAHAGGRHIELPLDTRNPVAVWRNARRLAALIRRERVVIVHARSRAPAWSAWLACRRTGAHFVTTYHGTYAENLPFKRTYNSVMARGEIVIAASRFIAELVKAQHGVPTERIRVIPRGVDPARFDPDAISHERLARLSRAWRLPDGVPTVVLPGRLTAWKGHAVLISALARLANRPHGRYRLSVPVRFGYRGGDVAAQAATGAVRYDISYDPARGRWYLDASWKTPALAARQDSLLLGDQERLASTWTASVNRVAGQSEEWVVNLSTQRHD